MNNRFWPLFLYIYYFMIFIVAILIVITAFFIITSHPKFGRNPRGERLERIKQSPNFKNGVFQNMSPTPQLADDANVLRVLKQNFTAKNRNPKTEIPSVKTNLQEIEKDENVLVWFGHSSYFMQIDGKTFLVDPVFSGHASPFSFAIKAFKGSDIYKPDDIPIIDYLIITHDHWDHLDYKTVIKLKPKTGKIITGLGVGAHFERWDFNKNMIIEKDWFESEKLNDHLEIFCLPTRHFSGRGFSPKKTLWSSFLLKTKHLKIFVGGDGGYDLHFRKIGDDFKKIDLAILENGQYNKAWKYIHTLPEQVLQAGKDLNAARIFPVHNSKFSLANHAWFEPLNRIMELNEKEDQKILTPKIGELVRLNDVNQEFEMWWKKII